MLSRRMLMVRGTKLASASALRNMVTAFAGVRHTHSILDHGIRNDAVVTDPVCSVKRATRIVIGKQDTFADASTGMSIALQNAASLSATSSNTPHISRILAKFDNNRIEIADPCPYTGENLHCAFGTQNRDRIADLYNYQEDVDFLWPAGKYLIAGGGLFQFNTNSRLRLHKDATLLIVGLNYAINFAHSCKSFSIEGGRIDTFGDAFCIVRGRSASNLQDLRIKNVVFQSTGNRRLTFPVAVNDGPQAKISIDKCAFLEGISTGIDVRWNSTGHVYGCRFEAIWRRGIFVVPTRGQGQIKFWRVEHNFFGPYRKSSSENLAKVPLQIVRGRGKEQAHGWIIRKNTFRLAMGSYDNDDQATIYSANVLECRGDHCIVEQNLIIGSGDVGIEIGQSKNVLVQRNRIIGSDGKGINSGSMMGGTPTKRATNPLIVSNRIENCGLIVNDEHDARGRGAYRAGIAIRGVTGGRVAHNVVINSWVRIKVELKPVPSLPVKRGVLVSNLRSGATGRVILYWPGGSHGDASKFPGTLTGEGTLVLKDVRGSWKAGDFASLGAASGAISHIRNVTNGALEVIGCEYTVVEDNLIKNKTGFDQVTTYVDWRSRFNKNNPLNKNQGVILD